MPAWIARTDPIGGSIAVFARKSPDITSASSHAFSTGSKTFAVASGLSISVDDWFAIEYVLFPKNFMIGRVTAYSGGSLTIDVVRAVGSGTLSNWRMVDVTPLYAPLTIASMQRLNWTSAHAAVSTTPALTQQVAITIPALALGDSYDNTFQLFAHGLGAACEVDGRVLNLGGSGVHIPIVGSLPVWVQTISGSANGFGTLVEIGSTSTHVVAIVKAMLSHDAAATVPGAMTITIEASAFDFTTAAVLPTGNPALPLTKAVPNSYLQLGRGRFDTRRRYPRKVASGNNSIYAKGPTLTIIGLGNTGARPAGATSGSYAQNEIGWRWRYACDGFVRQTERAWNGTATNGGTSTADVVRIKT